MPNLVQKMFLWLYCLDMRFFHTTGLLRYQGFQENYKRPTKVVKSKPKASGSSIPKLNNFFTSLGSFGVFCSQISLFLSFKAIKAKKAALVAGNANLHWGIFLDSKSLLYHPKVLFKLPLIQNRADKQKPGILKAKMCHKGHKIEEYPKITKYKNIVF